MTALLHTTGQLTHVELWLKYFRLTQKDLEIRQARLNAGKKTRHDTDHFAEEAISFHKHLDYRVFFYIH